MKESKIAVLHNTMKIPLAWCGVVCHLELCIIIWRARLQFRWNQHNH